MRQHLARLMAASTLAGCSLIYNPSNLPEKGEMPIDAPIADANPALLELTEVKSTPLLEGAGQDGSAPQLLVVYGMHILEDAMVTVAPTQANAAVMIDVSNVTIAKDRNSFAALVRAGYMDTIGEGTPIDLTVTVTQAGAAPKTIGWKLQPLDELTTPGIQNPPAPGKLYSRVNVNGTIELAAGQGRAIIRAVGSITATAVTANADGRTAGAGGCDGGMRNTDGACHGGGKRGNGGGGAGFAAMGTAGQNALGPGGAGGPISGNELITIYEGSGAAMNKGAGGGGGSGGVGGGGGGTIELTAGGNIAVTSNISANAADGENGSTLGSGGGGGAGGVVVIRAGNMLTLPSTLTLAGGQGGPGTGGSGGDGSVGRWRYDAAAVSNAIPMTPAPRRGPMIKRPANPIFNTRTPMLTVVGNQGDEIQIVTLKPDNTSATDDTILTSAELVIMPPELAIGINTVCVIVPGGNFANDEAKNCVDVAFLP